MRARKSSSRRSTAAGRGGFKSAQAKRDYAKELMDLAVEAANSRELPAFLAGFASRAAEMLNADWGGGGGLFGNRVQLYSSPKEFPASQSTWQWLLTTLSTRRTGLEVVPLEKRRSFCALLPIYASDGELMGTL